LATNNVSRSRGVLYSLRGMTPLVAFTEPRVPLVEVLGSGRAVMEPNPLQEAMPAANKTSKENVKVFITIVFISLVMKKAGHEGLDNPSFCLILMGQAIIVISIV
jgi:hypothetical protein